MAIVPEMISVFEAISVLEMPSSVFRKAMAKTTSGKPSEMATAAETAAGTEMTTATAEMPATEMAAATTEASTMPATEASTSSAMAAASSAVSECGGGRNRQNTGQNQTGKETVK
jgi:hypothetical protein